MQNRAVCLASCVACIGLQYWVSNSSFWSACLLGCSAAAYHSRGLAGLLLLHNILLQAHEPGISPNIESNSLVIACPMIAVARDARAFQLLAYSDERCASRS
jgi:hypothetical protein